MKDIANFIQQVGFPAFVAIYVLVRLEPLIQSNTEAINKLAIAISNLSEVDGNELSEQLNDNN
ncbi:YvrJ family protein [Sporohalobacter salinus]|uniref:YvrJ family protein n=1 Tax=Sporohalobacter salinus TaxID=1494606 RepID=UPI0019609712|nr:YvrJ family protein [Sporohalobacter salinus]MBM7624791.1 hypothetical protein [Sporohalobacter salinus]